MIRIDKKEKGFRTLPSSPGILFCPSSSPPAAMVYSGIPENRPPSPRSSPPPAPGHCQRSRHRLRPGRPVLEGFPRRPSQYLFVRPAPQHLSRSAHVLVLLLSLILLGMAPSSLNGPTAAAAAAAAASGAACKTNIVCENGGVCVHLPKAGDVCRCPRPVSALEPSFYVGLRCHIPAVMCADTDTFYCANGARCLEIVQGENYTCEGCNTAVAGPHCDADGVPCGPSGLKCFNGGTCSQTAGACICPVQWSGNENCTAPGQGQDGAGDTVSADEEQTWYVPLLGALGAVVMLSILGGLIYFCYAGQSAGPTHTPISSLAAIKDAEEILSLQEHGHDGDQDEETFELSDVAEAQRLQAIDHESPRH